MNDTIYIRDLMLRCIIGINDDERRENILSAVRLLRQTTQLLACSPFYRTRAIGREPQPDYLNGVCKIQTGLAPQVLKESVLEPIENKLLRARSADKYAPRTIDLDLLLYGEYVSGKGEYPVLPHPDIYLRAFVAIPLAKIDPHLQLPDTGISAAEAAEAFRAQHLHPEPSFSKRVELRNNHT